jgi:hypothetical protein
LETSYGIGVQLEGVKMSAGRVAETVAFWIGYPLSAISHPSVPNEFGLDKFEYISSLVLCKLKLKNQSIFNP